MKNSVEGTRIQSIERAVAVLQCFKQEPKLGITEISKMVGLHKSTTFGIVNTLLACDMLFQDLQTGKYQLGMEIVRLGFHADSKSVAIKPILHQLVAEFDETVNFVEHDNTHTIYCEKLESSHAMRICTNIGQRLPFYCTGVGRAILAYLPQDFVEAALDSYDFHAYTVHTIRDKETLLEQLETVRSQGYCIDDEEYELGLICIGVPIFTPAGEPAAGISISGPKYRLTTEKAHLIGRALIGYSQAIAKALYG